jgi:hypothetical protein
MAASKSQRERDRADLKMGLILVVVVSVLSRVPTRDPLHQRHKINGQPKRKTAICRSLSPRGKSEHAADIPLTSPPPSDEISATVKNGAKEKERRTKKR